MNPKVDWYFERAAQWRGEIAQLRSIVLDCGLEEELKWGCPSYTFQKSNIVLIHMFRDYCALLFFKGALLPDTHEILIRQTENVQAARQMRFTSLEQVAGQESIIKAYIFEAIEIEKAGLKVEMKKTAEFSMVEEFQIKLNENPALKSAFEALTPGRQRGYLLHFSQPKQAKTRAARIEKNLERILKGKGLED